MTVAELITALQALPNHAELVVRDDDEGLSTSYLTASISLWRVDEIASHVKLDHKPVGEGKRIKYFVLVE